MNFRPYLRLPEVVEKNTRTPAKALFCGRKPTTVVGVCLMAYDVGTMRAALRMYVTGAMAYGFTRAVTYDYKSSKEYYNGKTGKCETKDMLLVDKIGRISGMTVAAILVWPVMLGGDLARLECLVKDKDPKEFQ
jgi:hypothetical protein